MRVGYRSGRTRIRKALQRLALGSSLFLGAPGLGQEAPPVVVATDEIRERDFHDQLTLVGRTRARAESSIVSQVEGTVQSLDVREGRRVLKGTALVTIDSRRIALELAAKEAEIEQARAQAELAVKELARAEELVQTSVFPERDRDAAVAEAARSSARHEELEAERRRLKLDLEESVIRIPFTGYTVRRHVDVGEWVSRGAAVYEVVDLTVVEVALDLPERHFGRLERGSTVAITVSGDVARPLEGRVTGIAPKASETTHTFPVVVEVPNDEGRLGAGMLVRATVSLSGTFSSLAVSKDAVVRQGDRTMLFTVRDGQAQPIPVQLSSTDGQWVAVSGQGLSEGMPVVVRGNERIFPGSPVVVKE